MSELPKAISVRLRWWEWLMITGVFFYGSVVHDPVDSVHMVTPGNGLLCALVSGVAFGVWRVVKIAGVLLMVRWDNGEGDR